MGGTVWNNENCYRMSSLQDTLQDFIRSANNCKTRLRSITGDACIACGSYLHQNEPCPISFNNGHMEESFEGIYMRTEVIDQARITSLKENLQDFLQASKRSIESVTSSARNIESYAKNIETHVGNIVKDIREIRSQQWELPVHVEPAKVISSLTSSNVNENSVYIFDDFPLCAGNDKEMPEEEVDGDPKKEEENWVTTEKVEKGHEKGNDEIIKPYRPHVPFSDRLKDVKHDNQFSSLVLSVHSHDEFNDNDCTHTLEQKFHLQGFMEDKTKAAFTQDTKEGVCEEEEEIRLKISSTKILENDIKYVKKPKRRLNPVMQDEVRNSEQMFVHTWLTTTWRICTDYREIKFFIKYDPFPLLFIDKMLGRLTGREHYCFLNGLSGFYQVPIVQQSTQ